MKPFWDGQEVESGTIRRDPAGLCGRRDDQRIGEEARSASPDGPAGNRRRDSAGTKTTREGAASAGPAQRDHQSDSGTGPGCAAEAEAHCAPNFYATARRTRRLSDRRADGTALRGGTEGGVRIERPRSVRTSVLWARAGSTGGLV